jgi:flagellar basal-body rod protein FlgG
MTAQQLNVDNIAHNLANANTAGFKTRRAQFQDLLYQNVVQPGAAAGSQSTVPTGLQLGLGTRAASNEIVFTQGDFSQTNNPLDMVIQGRDSPDPRSSGELATRAPELPAEQRRQPGHLRWRPSGPQITIPQGANRSPSLRTEPSAIPSPDRRRAGGGQISWRPSRIPPV